MSEEEHRRKSDKDDRREDDDDDDDEEEDEDEDEDDEEEEEEDRARPKSKKRKSKRARLFMDEASEGEDEEEEEEGEMEEVDELPEYERQRRAERMRQEKEFAQMRPEDIAQRFQERHKREISTKGAAKFSGAATIETARLMRERPRTEDPKLFMVRCKPGEEKVLVLKLFNKYIRDKFKKPEPVDPMARKSRWVLPPPPGAELEIYSVLAPGTSGYIYVESMREECVKAAIKGVGGIFGGSVSVVPLDEMQDVLRVDLRKDIIRKDDFVRMRGPFPYKGDLAKVHAVLEGGNKFTVKLVPRIDMSTLSMDFTSKESQKIIPPAKHFNPDEIKALNGTVGRDTYQGSETMLDTFEDHYFENGLLLLDVSARQVQQLTQKPSLEEMERFFPPSASSNADKGDDLSVIAKEMEKMAQKQKKDQFDFGVGDKVFVIAGSEAGAQGTLENVDAYRNTGSMRMGQLLIEVRLKDIVKRFALGDHVKVLSGAHKGKTGNVVNVPPNSNKSVPYVIIYTDVSKEEIQVNNSDLKIASEISVGLDELNGYRLMDFVMLDQNQHGVIVRINTDSVRILMQTGEAKDLPTSAIRAKKNMDSKRATAPDMNNYPLHCQDHVVVSTGLYRGAEGVIRHIHRLLLFVHVKAREHENSGMIVVKSRDCRLAGSLQGGIARPGAAPNRPGMPFGPSAGGGGAGRVRDELQGKTVRIRRGNDKGLIGVVKEGGSAGALRVELNARNKVVIVPRDNVEVVDTRPTHSEPAPSPAAPYTAPASDFGQSSSYGRSYMAPPPMSYAAPAQAAPTSYTTPMSDFSDANRAARQAAQSNSAPQFEKGHEVTLVDTGETVKIYEVVDRDIVVIDKKGKMKIVSASNVVYA